MRTYERRDATGKVVERTANILPGSDYDGQLHRAVCRREDAGDLVGWWLAGDDGDDGTGGDDLERFVSLEALMTSAKSPPAAPDGQRVDAVPAVQRPPKPARQRGPKPTTSTPAPPAGQE